MATRITLHPDGRQLAYDDHHTSLLAALESHNIAIDYQCRAGYCGACRVRLRKGEVHYAVQPLACIRQDEILPCCCRAKGDIEIDLPPPLPAQDNGTKK